MARKVNTKFLAIATLVIVGLLVSGVVARKVFFGTMPAEFEGHIPPINAFDKIALVLLMAFMIGIGLFPALMEPWVLSGVQHILALLGGA